mmetsp:Transcript_69520/g.162795  ORF Transcript_69520/g.162795 Transcript_69520/m.162795 type:complete len:239 (-) Transcript_69520:46-762(-)
MSRPNTLAQLRRRPPAVGLPQLAQTGVAAGAQRKASDLPLRVRVAPEMSGFLGCRAPPAATGRQRPISGLPSVGPWPAGTQTPVRPWPSASSQPQRRCGHCRGHKPTRKHHCKHRSLLQVHWRPSRGSLLGEVGRSPHEACQHVAVAAGLAPQARRSPSATSRSLLAAARSSTPGPSFGSPAIAPADPYRIPLHLSDAGARRTASPKTPRTAPVRPASARASASLRSSCRSRTPHLPA